MFGPTRFGEVRGIELRCPRLRASDLAKQWPLTGEKFSK